MAARREGFFGTDNVHRAGWGVLLGLVGFFGGLAYQKISGPQKVVVEASHASTEQRQITTEVSPRSKEIADLTEAIRQLSKAAAGNADQKRLRELTTEVDRLRAEVAQAKRPPISTPQSDMSASALGSASASTNLSVSTGPVRFQLPDTVGGYTSEKIFGVSALTCPPRVVFPGSTLMASFNLNNQTLLSRASPLRATIVKVHSPTEVLQITEVWIDLRVGANVISLYPPLELGRYRLSYGFYLKDKLSGRFPPFYSNECSFDVKAT